MPTSHIKQISVGLNNSPAGLVQALDAFLAAEGGATLYDLSYGVSASPRHTGGFFTVTYRKPSTTQYRASFFVDDTILGSAEEQINAFLQLSDRRRPVQLIDMTPNLVRQEDNTALALVYTDSLLPSGNPGSSRAVLLRATAPIAVGASGNAQLVTANGADALTPLVTATNRGMYLWQAGLDAYAFIEPTTGAVFQAFPVGCNA
jgi:hypothetical protein